MTRRRITEKASHLLLIVIFLVFLPIGLLLFTDVGTLLVLDLELVMVLLLLCVRDVNKNIFFIGFILSLFIFLLSGDIAEELFHVYYWIRFDADANIHSHICIMISLICLYLGYISGGNTRKIAIIKSSSDEDFVSSIRRASRLFFYISYPVLLIETLYKVYYVLTNGYLSYYVTYSSLFPGIISKIQDVTPLALCVFLATMPKKQECKPILYLYFAYVLLGLFGGQRGLLVYNMVFLIGYLMFRNAKYSYGDVWIKKRTIVLIVFSIPFLFVLLFLYGYIRSNDTVIYNSFGDTFVKFFVNVGSSDKVIKSGYVYANEIPKWRFYSFGDTLNYFIYSKIFHPFSNTSISAHSAEYALNSHSFDSLISYLTMRTDFLNGHGAGSSFIAVLYADFGYLGVGIGSFLYGRLFKSISNIRLEDGWLLNAMKLYMLLFIMKAPRGSYDGFIAPIINLCFVACIVAFYFVAKSMNDRRKN
jgi:oligosaccharide repeat unit polymerase